MMPSNISYLPAKVYVFNDKAITDKKVLAKLSPKKSDKGKRPGSKSAKKKKK